MKAWVKANKFKAGAIGVFVLALLIAALRG